jgi:hypothetical protein
MNISDESSDTSSSEPITQDDEQYERYELAVFQDELDRYRTASKYLNHKGALVFAPEDMTREELSRLRAEIDNMNNMIGARGGKIDLKNPPLEIVATKAIIMTTPLWIDYPRQFTKIILFKYLIDQPNADHDMCGMIGRGEEKDWTVIISSSRVRLHPLY